MSSPSPETLAILDAWFSQKPAFALMGEYSAGKSTLLNLLLGRDVLPTQVTATNMPVIWLTYGDQCKAETLDDDGTLAEVAMDDMLDQAKNGQLLLRLTLPAEILKRTDIIDTPGISDPRLARGSLNFIGDYIDFAIWCTAANQAWRQSEKAMWTSLPNALRTNSLLALTRADTLKNPADLKKVLRRCKKETSDLFFNQVPIATVAALSAQSDDGSVSNQTVWQASHATQFFEALEVAMNTAVTACEHRPKIDLPAPASAMPAKKETGKPAKKASLRKKATAKPKARKSAPSKKKLGVASESKIQGLIEALKEMGKASDNDALNDPAIDTIEHHFNTFLGELRVSDDHRVVLLRAMSLERSGDVSLNAVIVQLVRELEDFADTPWCRLDQIH